MLIRLIVTSIIVGIVAFSCQQGSKAPNTPFNDSPVVDTLALVTAQCGRCHAVPDPADLNKVTWRQHVLPRMGYFMGIYDTVYTRAELLEPGAYAVQQAAVFPEKPVISIAQWTAIKDYILQRAPEKVEQLQLSFGGEQQLFKAIFPDLFLSPPGTILTRFSGAGNGLYYASDVNKEVLMLMDRDHRVLGQLPVKGGAVDIEESNNTLLVTALGSFSPTDLPSGQLLAFQLGQQNRSVVLIDSLQRPVHTAMGDLDSDGKTDFVISEFGKWTGRLAWWKPQPNGRYRPQVLRPVSGAISSVIADLNGDGYQDVVALFGQSDEGIWAFLGNGKGDFQEQRLLQFPASYGSSAFQLLDWDGDGKLDILYTCGDNADFPPIVKPYQGIRLFLQKDQLKWEEEWFQPLPGAYGAQVADFDLDGDLDLFAISFFPDFTAQPEQALVYFEQKASGQFERHPFAQHTAGRWICMDGRDMDGDGDTDLLLGSTAFEVQPDMGQVAKWTKNGLPWMLLENTTRDGK